MKKIKFFTIKPHLDESRINKIVDEKINKFLQTVRNPKVSITGYADNEIAISVVYEEMTESDTAIAIKNKNKQSK